MSDVTEDQIEALKVQHKTKDLYVFKKAGYTFVMKKPDSMAYRRWNMQVSEDKKNQYDASEELALSCTVWPSAHDLRAAFEDVPGLPVELGGELVAIAHRSDKQEAKKV